MKKNHVEILVFVLLVFLILGIRFNYYESLDRSVSGHDTERYTVSLDTPNFWRDLFTSNRQTTTTLVYKLLESQGGYKVTNLSSPGDFVQPPLVVQPGFDRITAFQSWLAIAAWISLALVVFRNLQNPAFKFLGAFLVLLFGFSPQVAEWDYVMLSEPISLSLFALLLAISIELAVRVSREGKSLLPLTHGLMVGWFFVVAAWVFTRDSNAYLLPVLLATILGLFAWKLIREKLPLRTVAIAGVLMLIWFLAASNALQRSGRWENPFFNNLLVHILPNPQYTAFFHDRGMPLTYEVRALEGSPLTQLAFFQIDYLVDWVRENGTLTYTEFILTHPGWALETIWNNTEAAFGESTQPFFTRNPDITPDGLFYLGRLLHPVHSSVGAIAAIQIAVFAILAFRGQTAAPKAIAGLFIVFFIGECVMYAVSILGDASSIVRHTMGAVMPMRLSLWLLPPFILDAAFLREEAPQKAPKASHGKMPKKKRS